MKISTEIKYFTNRQNLIFLSISLFLIWAWMFIAAEIDTGNDRGFLSIVGIALTTALILILFFSNNKIIDFFITSCNLLISSFLIFILTVTLGFYIWDVTKLNWIGFIVPILATGVFMFLNLRRLFSFPNNSKAFLVILALPIIVLLTLELLELLPFYDNIFKHEYGIGFPISIFLSFVFISISILCMEVNPKKQN